MNLDQFQFIQEQLVWAFWPFARWWLILFAVGGIGLAVWIFFLDFVGNWLDAR